MEKISRISTALHLANKKYWTANKSNFNHRCIWLSSTLSIVAKANIRNLEYSVNMVIRLITDQMNVRENDREIIEDQVRRNTSKQDRSSVQSGPGKKILIRTERHESWLTREEEILTSNGVWTLTVLLVILGVIEKMINLSSNFTLTHGNFRCGV